MPTLPQVRCLSSPVLLQSVLIFVLVAQSRFVQGSGGELRESFLFVCLFVLWDKSYLLIESFLRFFSVRRAAGKEIKESWVLR